MGLFKRLFGKKEAQAVEEVKQESMLQEEKVDTINETLPSEKVEEDSDEQEEAPVDEKSLSGEQGKVKVTETEGAPKVEEVNAAVEAILQDKTTEEAVQTEENPEVVEEIQVEEVEAKQENTQVEEVVAPVEKKKGFMKRLISGLTKTRDNFLKGVEDVLSNFKHIDEDLYEELEEALIMADFGVDTTLKIMDELRQKVKSDKITDPQALKVALQEIITTILTKTPTESILNPDGPTVILVIGVNGVGKTTSIGKMSHLYKSEGKKVLVAAADTFRAAAIEQLQVWCERAGVEIIKHDEGTDAAAVVFDAIAAAKARNSDVLICDTAGRLQNKTNLMKELEKISRIIAREYPEAKKEILIALDATTGQNAIQQVKLFKEVAEISGIILTKLDGTAKGGAIVGIYENFEVPVNLLGLVKK